MNLIKKLKEKKSDNLIHVQFQRFSRGEFRNRAVLKARHTNGKFTINTSSEFTNELVFEAAKRLGEEKTKVTGAIISTSDLKEKIEYTNIKQFQGVKRYLIDKEMSGTEILNLLNEYPKTVFALSFGFGDTVLKIKPKAPKSGKPGKGDEAPKADFCKLITKDKEWGTSFIFEKPDFSKAELKHTFFVEKITVPEELKSEKDFSKVREMALREGRIIREGIIDEKEVKSEIEFSA